MKQLEFVNNINVLVSDKLLQRQLLTLAVGIYLGQSFDLPSSRVDNKTQYYLGTHMLNANSVISQTNEWILIDTASASDIAKNIWLSRYDFAFPNAAFTSATLLKGGPGTLGISDEQKQTLINNTIEIETMLRLLMQVFNVGENYGES